MDTKALRQKVLDLAIRGKLVPQDPNDEPASVLLARIRQQKQQMVKDGKLKAKDIKNDTIIFVGEDNLHYEKFADGSVKCIEDEIPFDLPEGWAWVRLSSIADMALGKMLDVAKNRGSLRPYLRNINVRWGAFELSDILEMRFEYDELERYSIRHGDLVICEGGEPGRCAVWQSEEVVFYQKALHRVRAIEVLPEYLYYVIRHFIISTQYERYYTGTTIKHLTGQSLRILPIPLPPTSQQQSIVKRLQQIIDEIDRIEAEKTDAQSLVALAKSKILDLAIRGQLVPQNPTDEPASVLLERIRAEKEELIRQGKTKRDKKESIIFRGEDNSYYEKIGNQVENVDDEIPFELPEGWVWCRGYSCFEGMESTKPQGDYFDYIDIDAIDNRLHRIKEAKHLPVSDAPSRASRAVKNGSVLFSLVRPYLENIALVKEKHSNCIASTGFYVCNSNGVLLPEFMFFLMISGYVVKGLNQYMKGDNSPSISKDNIESWLYPVPPLEEQKAICSKLKSIFTMIENVEKSLS